MSKEVFFFLISFCRIILFLPKAKQHFDWKRVTEPTLGNERKAELMQSEAHFYPKSPRNIQYYSLFLHSAQSFNQLSPTVAKSHVAPK